MQEGQGDMAKEFSTSMDAALERLLAPVAQLERLKRKEYLTPDEVEIVYGLKAVTLANKRTRSQGPEYIKDGERILYRQQAVRAYLEARTIRTR